MKNQFFADKRDYFKYAVLELMMEGRDRYSQLSMVWMLTSDTGTSHGNRRFAPIPGRERLAAFLNECRENGTRDVRAIGDYFRGVGVPYKAHGEVGPPWFGARIRGAYFDSIPDSTLTASVVFIDPDNGIEPPGGPSDAHVTQEELQSVFERLDLGSLMVVYQHLARIRGDVFWPRLVDRVSTCLGARVAIIAESDVGLVFAPREPQQFETVLATLQRHRAAAAQAGERVRIWL